MDTVDTTVAGVPAETKEKGLKAKTVSLIGKIIAVVVLVGGLLLKAFNVCQSLEVNDICKVAFSIMGIFGTVDINIMLDKVFNR